MNPEVWGKRGWFFIHNIPLNYPREPTERDKLNYKIFFTSIANVLPCSICSFHYKQNLIEKELDKGLNSQIDLFKWTVDMHNKVNKKTGKRELSYLEALDHINRVYRNETTIWKYLTISNFLIVVLLILVIYLYRKSNTRYKLPF